MKKHVYLTNIGYDGDKMVQHTNTNEFPKCLHL